MWPLILNTSYDYDINIYSDIGDNRFQWLSHNGSEYFKSLFTTESSSVTFNNVSGAGIYMMVVLKIDNATLTNVDDAYNTYSDNFRTNIIYLKN